MFNNRQLICCLYSKEAGGTYYSTYFDNSNQRTFVQQPQKVGMFALDYVQREAAIIKHKINQT